MAAARTLPWSWYSDPEVLRREQERIFRRAWQYVGHAGRVAEVGERFAAWAGEVPILVVRAEDGISAFLNVCRHRGSLLVEGDAAGKTIQCPYHAWTYGLDGSLRAAPRSEREPGFDTSDTRSSLSASRPGARSSSSTRTRTRRRSPRRSAR